MGRSLPGETPYKRTDNQLASLVGGHINLADIQIFSLSGEVIHRTKTSVQYYTLSLVMSGHASGYHTIMNHDLHIIQVSTIMMYVFRVDLVCTLKYHGSYSKSQSCKA